VKELYAEANEVLGDIIKVIETFICLLLFLGHTFKQDSWRFGSIHGAKQFDKGDSARSRRRFIIPKVCC
jgi:hypothetical protein